MAQHKIARMKCLRLEAGTVTRDQEPMADLVPQQLDSTNGRKFTPKLWI